MNTRGKRNSAGGGRCKSFEHQGPEAVHDGDLCVCGRIERAGYDIENTFWRCEMAAVRKSSQVKGGRKGMLVHDCLRSDAKRTAANPTTRRRIRAHVRIRRGKEPDRTEGGCGGNRRRL